MAKEIEVKLVIQLQVQMVKQLTKLRNLVWIIILLFGFGLQGQNVQIKRQNLNYILSEVWKTDSCGSLGLRQDIAFFIYENEYLINQPLDSLILLLGNPDYNQGVSAGEYVWSYCLSCLEDDKNNCIKDGDACLGIIKIWINVRSKRVSLVSIRNG